MRCSGSARKPEKNIFLSLPLAGAQRQSITIPIIKDVRFVLQENRLLRLLQ